MNQVPALKTEKTIIDGHQIETTVFPTLFAVRLKTRMMKKIFPSLGKFVSSINPNDLALLKGKGQTQKTIGDFISCLDMNLVGDAFAVLSQNIEPEELQDILLTTFAQTRIDGQEAGKEEVFNIAFAGKMLLMYKVFFFVIGVNFGDFFALLRTGMSMQRISVPGPETKKSTEPSKKTANA